VTNTSFFHPSLSDHSLLFVLTALIIQVISAGGGCDTIEDWQGVGAEPEGCGSGSGEVQDRQQGGTGWAAGRSRLEQDRKRVGPAPCR